MIKLAAALLALMITPALAHPECPNPTPAKELLDKLAEKAGEITMMQATKGEKNNETRVVITVSQNGTWSFVTIEEGQACMTMFGRSFSFVVGEDVHVGGREL